MIKTLDYYLSIGRLFRDRNDYTNPGLVFESILQRRNIYGGIATLFMHDIMQISSDRKFWTKDRGSRIFNSDSVPNSNEWAIIEGLHQYLSN